VRTPLVAGNWKMNKTVTESIELAMAIRAGALPPAADVEAALLPPFTSLWPVAEVIRDSGIQLGCQDIYWEDKGAFTGEISPIMVTGWCRYALVGHSERRRLFGETDEQVNRKALARRYDRGAGDGAGGGV
jgi:triosephosphate isomerase